MKAIIFDLDYCLCAGDAVGAVLYEPAFAAIRRANNGSLTDAQLAAAFFDCWSKPLDFVVRQHGFSEEMKSAAWRIFATMEVSGPMHGYPDLAVLGELDALRFLVTSGFRRLQESKIQALGIARLFTAIHIDAIDEPERSGKQALFAEILAAHQLAANEVLVVGDNPDSEIRAGNNLGITTVQMLRPGVPVGSSASHHVYNLAELKSRFHF